MPPPPGPLVEDITRDPREAEDWFRRLPPGVQETTQAAWRAERECASVWDARCRAPRRRSVAEGAGLLAVAIVLAAKWHPWTRLVVLVVAALGVGAAIGWTAERFGLGRAGCCILGGLAAVTLHATLGHAHVGYAMVAASCASLLFMAWGIRRESRSFVGAE
ncbi:MAG: hypothetical protein AAF628_05190 [Planctomycetota bacterium]